MPTYEFSDLCKLYGFVGQCAGHAFLFVVYVQVGFLLNFCLKKVMLPALCEKVSLPIVQFDLQMIALFLSSLNFCYTVCGLLLRNLVKSGFSSVTGFMVLWLAVVVENGWRFCYQVY